MREGRFDVERGERTLVLRRYGADGLGIATKIFAGVALVGLVAAPSIPGAALLGAVVILSVCGLPLSLMWCDRLGSGRVLGRVRRALEVRPASGGYREGGLEVVVDRERFDAARVREIATRRIENGEQQIVVAWLVLQDRAFVIDQSQNGEGIEKLATELRNALELKPGDKEGAAEPGTLSNILAVMFIMLLEIAAMSPGMALVFASSPLFLRLAVLEVAVVTALFAVILVPWVRHANKRRGRLLFGF